jgi:hypothetical protein
MRRRRCALAGALAAALAASPALAADDTITGTLVSVEDGGKELTIESGAGQRHTFEITKATAVRAGGEPVALDEVEPGTDVEVKSEAMTEVREGEHRRASAVTVVGRADDETQGAPDDNPLGTDPASPGAPGGGPPSGGIPSGGVPSGGSPSGGIPTGGGLSP